MCETNKTSQLGRIVHDINNPLATLKICAVNLLDNINNNDLSKAKEKIAILLRNIDKISEIVTRMARAHPEG